MSEPALVTHPSIDHSFKRFASVVAGRRHGTHPSSWRRPLKVDRPTGKSVNLGRKKITAGHKKKQKKRVAGINLTRDIRLIALSLFLRGAEEVGAQFFFFSLKGCDGPERIRFRSTQEPNHSSDKSEFCCLDIQTPVPPAEARVSSPHLLPHTHPLMLQEPCGFVCVCRHEGPQ